MKKLSKTLDDASDPGDWTQLQEIAELVGCPVSAFFTGSSGVAGVDDTLELLSLWASIQTDADRQRVLAAIREIGSSAGSPQAEQS